MTDINWNVYVARKARRGQSNRKAYLLNELKGMTLHIDHIMITSHVNDDRTKVQVDHLKKICHDMLNELDVITYAKK